MLLSSQISLTNLLTLCQAFRVAHGAGLPLVDIFEQQGRKGPFAARPIIRRIAEKLRGGDALEETLKAETAHFPSLFISMVIVGEQTGNLPEIFRELERYYRLQLTLRRQFIAQIAWPVMELVGGIGAITLFILILGWLPVNDNPVNGRYFDPLGFGVGMAGAIRFLFIVGVFFGGLFLLYVVATRALGQKAAVHRFILNVPGIGPCFQAVALSRLSLALHLTMDSSLSTPKAVKRSLFASGNAAYEACGDRVASDVKKGDEVSEALGKCGVFPEEFVQAVHSGEVSGQLPEVMGRQAEHYHEEASYKLQILNRLLGVAVLGFIIIIFVIAILKLAMFYTGMIDNAGSTDLSKPLY